ncbi:hypothetical protein RIF29_03933 [Crotalaria pallida]|uniref:Uncharacterized protein n=1 Tax=Crotalaria pallida TaxID=3830 RepID=A0AAN9J1F1_CROPI
MKIDVVEVSFEGDEEISHSLTGMIVEDSFEDVEEIPHASMEIKIVEDSSEGDFDLNKLPDDEDDESGHENREIKKVADFDLNTFPEDEDDEGGHGNMEFKKVGGLGKIEGRELFFIFLSSCCIDAVHSVMHIH